MTPSVGMRLVEGLAARGVSVVFGIPGVHTVELYRGLAGGTLRHVTARHEQGCAFMADGYARASGNVGVAFVITGPGVLNTLTAIAQARADSVPILVVSGVNAQGTLGRGLGHLHEMPGQSALIAQLCPTRSVNSADELGPALDWAFATMTGARPTPVHLQIPTDVMPLPCPPLPAPLALPAPAVASAADLARAAQMLNASQRPVILSGGGARSCGAALQTLAQALDAPVVQTVNARGLMHGHALVVPASPSLDAVRTLIAGADSVLVLGSELGPTDYDMYARGGFPDLAHMIRVDLCAAQLARHPAALPICADAGAVAAALIPMIQRNSVPADGAARAATTRSAARAELSSLDAAMPARLEMIEAIRSAMPRAQIVGDSTQPIYAANLYYDHDRAGGWFNAATGFGALGYGVGAAIGAAIAQPEARTICIIGDGGLQFTASELRTAVDESLTITFIIWNNSAYGEIADAMRAADTQVIGCHPSPLDHAAFAKACGMAFQSIPMTPQALHAALIGAQNGPRIIEITAP
jgi:acetolactate synthase I/II/III large subunit